MIETEILIYGGGTSGTCAAIQAARRGANVIVIEPSKWIGGMITAPRVIDARGFFYRLVIVLEPTRPPVPIVRGIHSTASI